MTQHVAGLKNRLDCFEAILDARSKEEVIKFIYEELYFSEISQHAEQVAAIWDRLGIASLELERYQRYLRPEAMKINSAATYAFLPNAREIQEACGNDVTGWLFE